MLVFVITNTSTKGGFVNCGLSQYRHFRSPAVPWNLIERKNGYLLFKN